MTLISRSVDLTPLGFRGWFAAPVYRTADGVYVHEFSAGADGLPLRAEGGTSADAFSGMIARVSKLAHQRRQPLDAGR